MDGDGKLTSENRNVSVKPHIESRENLDVEIIEGAQPGVKVEADENLLPYIITEDDGDKLVIKTKDNTSLSSPNKIKVYITTDKLEDVDLEGSGNITGTGEFTGADHLKLSIAGSGNISIQVNTPKVTSSIAGTGNIILAGETKDSKIDIAGVGEYKAEELKSENVDVRIAGSGNAHVFADVSLDINIAGSGDVYYKGSPSVQQHVAGSGNIRQIQ